MSDSPLLIPVILGSRTKTPTSLPQWHEPNVQIFHNRVIQEE
ncbi:MAG: hypothetical protein ACRDEA_10515 [Microcystaceae cyanobacterium]